MKIKRLDLKAFGHFTEHSIDFNSEAPGLHIIYGPNEAGKSTALRALQGLLYGIPVRTADNFLHNYSNLMVGGHLENSDGKELIFWRRKKNVGDLLDADQNIIGQDVLAEFLHGIEEPLFTALFGIDHETLVSGGRDILEQKGDIGQALFSAGAGLSSLHGLIESMDKECEGLFKSGGSKPALNQAIKAYQDIKREIRTLSLSSSDWKKQQDIFEATSGELESIDTRKRELSAELEQLKRLQRAIPYLVKRVTLHEQLTSLGSFDHLPLDYSERLHEALTSKRQLESALEDAKSRQSELEQRKANTTLRQDILDQSETIDELHQRLGAQRQALNDRPRIKDQLLEAQTKAEILLNQVAPTFDLTQTDKIKELLDRRTLILPLGHRFAALDQALTQATTRVDALNEEHTRLQRELKQLTEVGDLRGLTAAVTTAHKVGDIDTTLRTLEHDAGGLKSNAVADLKQAGLWEGPIEDLLTLPLPSAEKIDMFVEHYREADERQRQNQKDQRDLQEELDRNRRDIEAIKKAGGIATEDDLSMARSHRDRGWQLIKSVWLSGETLEEEVSEYDENKDLPGSFERSMYSADEVSDQLRSAAERVHQFASLQAEVEKLERQLQRLNEGAAEIAEQKKKLKHDWLAVWDESQITPRSPREMRSWIDQYQDIRRNLREASQKEADKQPLTEQRKQLCAALRAELKGLGYDKEVASDELSPLLVYAEQILSELKAREDQRQKVLADHNRNQAEGSRATEELSKAQQAMRDWAEQWAAALDGFGLPQDASAEDATNALESLRSCLDKSAEIEAYNQRLEDIDRHAQDFDESVQTLVKSITPELGELTSGQAVVKLQAMVKEAEKTKSVVEKLTEDLESIKEEIRQSGLNLKEVQSEIANLRELASCETDEELMQVDARFRERQSIEKTLADVEETLHGIAEGIDLEELEQQRQRMDPNEIPGQIEGLVRQINDELEPQIRSLSEKKGAAYSELQKMDGSGEAAVMEEKAQAALAKVRRLADRYLRVRLSSQFLKKEIERYREDNQAPILKTASRYFAELTLGAFSGLRSDLDDHGNPILVGVCPDGGLKTVAEMSSGTRDQLYLALRLATLEWRLEKHEPMPFIADDILVNFDDQRTKATLKALTELAKKNQVILFTHHNAVISSVKSLEAGLEAENQLKIHQLN